MKGHQFAPEGALVLPASDRQAYKDMLQSGVAWLGRLGELRSAVLDEDWNRARELAEVPLTYPEPYPRRQRR